MSEADLLAGQFEEHRAHLRAVAYRMLGNTAEADDAVQDAWLRLSRHGPDEVDNLGGWLTTVVARVCLDMLRSRVSRREDPIGVQVPDDLSSLSAQPESDPEQEALLADAVGPALLVVLETLTPAERLAFVLHDLFAVPFDEIAPVVGRTPLAARQLASRARRRVQGADAPDAAAGGTRQREIVAAFLAAARGGNFDGLLALLDPDVVMRPDAAALAMGSVPGMRGARDVASVFSGGAKVARLALVDGVPGALWSRGGEPKVAFLFTLTEDGSAIAAIDLIADTDRLAGMELEVLRERR